MIFGFGDWQRPSTYVFTLKTWVVPGAIDCGPWNVTELPTLTAAHAAQHLYNNSCVLAVVGVRPTSAIALETGITLAGIFFQEELPVGVTVDLGLPSTAGPTWSIAEVLFEQPVLGTTTLRNQRPWTAPGQGTVAGALTIPVWDHRVTLSNCHWGSIRAPPTFSGSYLEISGSTIPYPFTPPTPVAVAGRPLTAKFSGNTVSGAMTVPAVERLAGFEVNDNVVSAALTVEATTDLGSLSISGNTVGHYMTVALVTGIDTVAIQRNTVGVLGPALGYTPPSSTVTPLLLSGALRVTTLDITGNEVFAGHKAAITAATVLGDSSETVVSRHFMSLRVADRPKPALAKAGTSRYHRHLAALHRAAKAAAVPAALTSMGWDSPEEASGQNVVGAGTGRRLAQSVDPSTLPVVGIMCGGTWTDVQTVIFRSNVAEVYATTAVVGISVAASLRTGAGPTHPRELLVFENTATARTTASSCVGIALSGATSSSTNALATVTMVALTRNVAAVHANAGGVVGIDWDTRAPLVAGTTDLAVSGNSVRASAASGTAVGIRVGSLDAATIRRLDIVSCTIAVSVGLPAGQGSAVAISVGAGAPCGHNWLASPSPTRPDLSVRLTSNTVGPMLRRVGTFDAVFSIPTGIYHEARPAGSNVSNAAPRGRCSILVVETALSLAPGDSPTATPLFRSDVLIHNGGQEALIIRCNTVEDLAVGGQRQPQRALVGAAEHGLSFSAFSASTVIQCRECLPAFECLPGHTNLETAAECIGSRGQCYCQCLNGLNAFGPRGLQCDKSLVAAAPEASGAGCLAVAGQDLSFVFDPTYNATLIKRFVIPFGLGVPQMVSSKTSWSMPGGRQSKVTMQLARSTFSFDYAKAGEQICDSMGSFADKCGWLRRCEANNPAAPAVIDDLLVLEAGPGHQSHCAMSFFEGLVAVELDGGVGGFSAAPRYSFVEVVRELGLGVAEEVVALGRPSVLNTTVFLVNSTDKDPAPSPMPQPTARPALAGTEAIIRTFALENPETSPILGTPDGSRGVSGAVGCEAYDVTAFDVHRGKVGTGTAAACTVENDDGTTRACATMTEYHVGCMRFGGCAGFTTVLRFTGSAQGQAVSFTDEELQEADTNNLIEVPVAMHIAEGYADVTPEDLTNYDAVAGTVGVAFTGAFYAKPPPAARTCTFTTAEPKDATDPAIGTVTIYVAQTAMASGAVEVFGTEPYAGSPRVRLARCGSDASFAARPHGTTARLDGEDAQCSAYFECAVAVSAAPETKIEVVAPGDVRQNGCPWAFSVIATFAKTIGATPIAPPYPGLNASGFITRELLLSTEVLTVRSLATISVVTSTAVSRSALKIRQTRWACTPTPTTLVSNETLPRLLQQALAASTRGREADCVDVAVVAYFYSTPSTIPTVATTPAEVGAASATGPVLECGGQQPFAHGDGLTEQCGISYDCEQRFLRPTSAPAGIAVAPAISVSVDTAFLAANDISATTTQCSGFSAVLHVDYDPAQDPHGLGPFPLRPEAGIAPPLLLLGEAAAASLTIDSTAAWLTAENISGTAHPVVSFPGPADRKVGFLVPWLAGHPQNATLVERLRDSSVFSCVMDAVAVTTHCDIPVPANANFATVSVAQTSFGVNTVELQLIDAMGATQPGGTTCGGRTNRFLNKKGQTGKCRTFNDCINTFIRSGTSTSPVTTLRMRVPNTLDNGGCEVAFAAIVTFAHREIRNQTCTHAANGTALPPGLDPATANFEHQFCQADRTCIPRFSVCDGNTRDCSTGDDETTCTLYVIVDQGLNPVTQMVARFTTSTTLIECRRDAVIAFAGSFSLMTHNSTLTGEGKSCALWTKQDAVTQLRFPASNLPPAPPGNPGTTLYVLGTVLDTTGYSRCSASYHCTDHGHIVNNVTCECRCDDGYIGLKCGTVLQASTATTFFALVPAEHKDVVRTNHLQDALRGDNLLLSINVETAPTPFDETRVAFLFRPTSTTSPAALQRFKKTVFTPDVVSAVNVRLQQAQVKSGLPPTVTLDTVFAMDVASTFIDIGACGEDKATRTFGCATPLPLTKGGLMLSGSGMSAMTVVPVLEPDAVMASAAMTAEERFFYSTAVATPAPMPPTRNYTCDGGSIVIRNAATGDCKPFVCVLPFDLAEAAPGYKVKEFRVFPTVQDACPGASLRYAMSQPHLGRPNETEVITIRLREQRQEEWLFYAVGTFAFAVIAIVVTSVSAIFVFSNIRVTTASLKELASGTARRLTFGRAMRVLGNAFRRATGVEEPEEEEQRKVRLGEFDLSLSDSDDGVFSDISVRDRDRHPRALRRRRPSVRPSTVRAQSRRNSDDDVAEDQPLAQFTLVDDAFDRFARTHHGSSSDDDGAPAGGRDIRHHPGFARAGFTDAVFELSSDEMEASLAVIDPFGLEDRPQAPPVFDVDDDWSEPEGDGLLAGLIITGPANRARPRSATSRGRPSSASPRGGRPLSASPNRARPSSASPRQRPLSASPVRGRPSSAKSRPGSAKGRPGSAKGRPGSAKGGRPSSAKPKRPSYVVVQSPPPQGPPPVTALLQSPVSSHPAAPQSPQSAGTGTSGSDSGGVVGYTFSGSQQGTPVRGEAPAPPVKVQWPLAPIAPLEMESQLLLQRARRSRREVRQALPVVEEVSEDTDSTISNPFADPDDVDTKVSFNTKRDSTFVPPSNDHHLVAVAKEKIVVFGWIGRDAIVLGLAVVALLALSFGGFMVLVWVKSRTLAADTRALVEFYDSSVCSGNGVVTTYPVRATAIPATGECAELLVVGLSDGGLYGIATCDEETKVAKLYLARSMALCRKWQNLRRYDAPSNNLCVPAANYLTEGSVITPPFVMLGPNGTGKMGLNASIDPGSFIEGYATAQCVSTAAAEYRLSVLARLHPVSVQVANSTTVPHQRESMRPYTADDADVTVHVPMASTFVAPVLVGGTRELTTATTEATISVVKNAHHFFGDNDVQRIVAQTDMAFGEASRTVPITAAETDPALTDVTNMTVGDRTDLPNRKEYPLGWIFGGLGSSVDEVVGEEAGPEAHRYFGINRTLFDIGAHYGPTKALREEEGRSATLSLWIRATNASRGFAFAMVDHYEDGLTGRSRVLARLTRLANEGKASSTPWFQESWHAYGALFVDGPALRLQYLAADPLSKGYGQESVMRAVWDLSEMGQEHLFNGRWHRLSIGMKNENNRFFLLLDVDGVTRQFSGKWRKCFPRRPTAMVNQTVVKREATVLETSMVASAGPVMYVGYGNLGASMVESKTSFATGAEQVRGGTRPMRIHAAMSYAMGVESIMAAMLLAAASGIFVCMYLLYQIRAEAEKTKAAFILSAKKAYLQANKGLFANDYIVVSFDVVREWLHLSRSALAQVVEELIDHPCGPNGSSKLVQAMWQSQREWAVTLDEFDADEHEMGPGHGAGFDVDAPYPTPDGWEMLLRAKSLPTEPYLVLSELTAGLDMDADISDLAGAARAVAGAAKTAGGQGQASVGASAQQQIPTTGVNLPGVGGVQVQAVFISFIGTMQAAGVYASGFAPVPELYNKYAKPIIDTVSISMAFVEVWFDHPLAVPIMQLAAASIFIVLLALIFANDDRRFYGNLARYQLRRDVLEHEGIEDEAFKRAMQKHDADLDVDGRITHAAFQQHYRAHILPPNESSRIVAYLTGKAGLTGKSAVLIPSRNGVARIERAATKLFSWTARFLRGELMDGVARCDPDAALDNNDDAELGLNDAATDGSSVSPAMSCATPVPEALESPQRSPQRSAKFKAFDSEADFDSADVVPDTPMAAAFSSGFESLDGLQRFSAAAPGHEVGPGSPAMSPSFSAGSFHSFPATPGVTDVRTAWATPSPLVRPHGILKKSDPAPITSHTSSARTSDGTGPTVVDAEELPETPTPPGPEGSPGEPSGDFVPEMDEYGHRIPAPFGRAIARKVEQSYDANPELLSGGVEPLQQLGYKCVKHGKVLEHMDYDDVYPYHHRRGCCAIDSRFEEECGTAHGPMYVCTEQDSDGKYICGYALCEKHCRAEMPNALFLHMRKQYQEYLGQGLGWFSEFVLVNVALALYTPVLQTCVMIIGCHPLYQCEFGDCWVDLDRRFIAAVYLATVTLGLFGAGFPAVFIYILLGRVRALRSAFFSPRYDGRYVRNTTILESAQCNAHIHKTSWAVSLFARVVSRDTATDRAQETFATSWLKGKEPWTDEEIGQLVAMAEGNAKGHVAQPIDDLSLSVDELEGSKRRRSSMSMLSESIRSDVAMWDHGRPDVDDEVRSFGCFGTGSFAGSVNSGSFNSRGSGAWDRRDLASVLHAERVEAGLSSGSTPPLSDHTPDPLDITAEVMPEIQIDFDDGGDNGGGEDGGAEGQAEGEGQPESSKPPSKGWGFKKTRRNWLQAAVDDDETVDFDCRNMAVAGLDLADEASRDDRAQDLLSQMGLGSSDGEDSMVEAADRDATWRTGRSLAAMLRDDEDSTSDDEEEEEEEEEEEADMESLGKESSDPQNNSDDASPEDHEDTLGASSPLRIEISTSVDVDDAEGGTQASSGGQGSSGHQGLSPLSPSIFAPWRSSVSSAGSAGGKSPKKRSHVTFAPAFELEVTPAEDALPLDRGEPLTLDRPWVSSDSPAPSTSRPTKAKKPRKKKSAAAVPEAEVSLPTVAPFGGADVTAPDFDLFDVDADAEAVAPPPAEDSPADATPSTPALGPEDAHGHADADADQATPRPRSASPEPKLRMTSFEPFGGIDDEEEDEVYDVDILGDDEDAEGAEDHDPSGPVSLALTISPTGAGTFALPIGVDSPTSPAAAPAGFLSSPTKKKRRTVSFAGLAPPEPQLENLQDAFIDLSRSTSPDPTSPTPQWRRGSSLPLLAQFDHRPGPPRDSISLESPDVRPADSTRTSVASRKSRLASLFSTNSSGRIKPRPSSAASIFRAGKYRSSAGSRVTFSSDAPTIEEDDEEDAPVGLAGDHDLMMDDTTPRFTFTPSPSVPNARERRRSSAAAPYLKTGVSFAFGEAPDGDEGGLRERTFSAFARRPSRRGSSVIHSITSGDFSAQRRRSSANSNASHRKSSFAKKGLAKAYRERLMTMTLQRHESIAEDDEEPPLHVAATKGGSVVVVTRKSIMRCRPRRSVLPNPLSYIPPALRRESGMSLMDSRRSSQAFGSGPVSLETSAELGASLQSIHIPVPGKGGGLKAGGHFGQTGSDGPGPGGSGSWSFEEGSLGSGRFKQFGFSGMRNNPALSSSRFSINSDTELDEDYDMLLQKQEVQEAEWLRFLNTDKTVLQLLYKDSPFERLPAVPMMTLGRFVLLVPPLLTEPSSFEQYLLICAGEITFCVLFLLFAPFTSPWMTLTTLLGSIHQFLLVALQAHTSAVANNEDVTNTTGIMMASISISYALLLGLIIVGVSFSELFIQMWSKHRAAKFFDDSNLMRPLTYPLYRAPVNDKGERAVISYVVKDD